MRKTIWIVTAALALCGAGCARETRQYTAEHSAQAAMASCLATTVYYPDIQQGLIAEDKLLPWQTHMEEYVLSYVLSQEGVAYDCVSEQGLALLNITGFPVFDNADEERNAVMAVVNTLLELPHVDRVALRFDGQKLIELKNGTAVNEIFEKNTGE